MEWKLRYGKFRKVLDPRRSFRPAFGVTGIGHVWYRCTVGVIVICFGSLRSTRENFRNAGITSESAANMPGSTWRSRPLTWKHLWQVLEHLESLWSTLGKSSSLRTLPVRLEIIATTYCSTIFKTHIFSLYYHQCIYIATQLQTEYLGLLQAVYGSNWRCAWRWRLSVLRDGLKEQDRGSVEIHMEAII